MRKQWDLAEIPVYLAATRDYAALVDARWLLPDAAIKHSREGLRLPWSAFRGGQRGSPDSLMHEKLSERIYYNSRFSNFGEAELSSPLFGLTG